MRPRVVFSTRLPEPAAALLHECEVVLPPGEASFPREAFAERLADAAGAVVLLSEPVDRALLDRAPNLRVLANYAVGVNNIDVAEATRRGIVVTNTPDVLTDATADLAFGLLLAAARRFPEGEALARSGAWAGWAPTQLLGANVAGATLGLVGFGRIGQAVARRAAGFGMRVLYAARHRADPVLEAALRAEPAPLDRLLAESDFVSLHCPLTAETRHLIDGAALARMKPGAILVNTARGPVVDESALAEALASGRLGGAGLDVYEEEPRIHPALLACDRAVILPHLGSATVETRRRMAELVGRSVAEVLAGRRPPNVVNPEVYALTPR